MFTNLSGLTRYGTCLNFYRPVEIVGGGLPVAEGEEEEEEEDAGLEEEAHEEEEDPQGQEKAEKSSDSAFSRQGKIHPHKKVISRGVHLKF